MMKVNARACIYVCSFVGIEIFWHIWDSSQYQGHGIGITHNPPFAYVPMHSRAPTSFCGKASVRSKPSSLTYGVTHVVCVGLGMRQSKEGWWVGERVRVCEWV